MLNFILGRSCSKHNLSEDEVELQLCHISHIYQVFKIPFSGMRLDVPFFSNSLPAFV